jgi:hypothetical protein
MGCCECGTQLSSSIVAELNDCQLLKQDYNPLSWLFVSKSLEGRAIAQAVSRWLPTAAARVRVRAEHVGFVVGKVTMGQVSSEYFGFPCQSSFHQFLHPHNHPGEVQ